MEFEKYKELYIMEPVAFICFGCQSLEVFGKKTLTLRQSLRELLKVLGSWPILGSPAVFSMTTFVVTTTLIRSENLMIMMTVIIKTEDLSNGQVPRDLGT